MTGTRVRPEPPIRARGLTRRYGEITAVDHLDLDVQAGEIYGLLGQNGAGKTTTILMLLGLTEPTEGRARVVGLDPARQPREVKRRVGYLPDAVGFYGNMTGRQNVRYIARLNGLGGREADRAIDDALGQVGLADRADDRVDTYSRGMRQRLGLADALVKSPDVLILDEPTTAIDPLGVVEILDLLRRLVRERGLTIMLSSHLLGQVQSVCDRVGIFASGRLIGSGTVAQLTTRFGGSDATIEVALELDDDAAMHRATAVLTAIDDVASVTPPDRPGQPWRLVASRAAERAVRERIAATATTASLRLTELRAVAPTLDDIYRTALAQTGMSAHGEVTSGRPAA